MSSVPAWATVAIAFVTAGLGFLGSLLVARSSVKMRRQELRQEWVLHGVDARLEALDEATVASIEYRERIGAALSLIAEADEPRLGIEPLWSFDRPDVTVFLQHDASLSLRVGRDHPVAVAWRKLAWEIGQGAVLASEERHWTDAGAAETPAPLRKTAETRRRGIRLSMEWFLELASSSLDEGRYGDSNSGIQTRIKTGLARSSGS